jgi:EmrB/QacA subfamily drug resistance transporter
MTDSTMTDLHTKPPVSAHDHDSGRAKWFVLAVLALAQLMVVLDATIVNIALPRAQTDLGFSDGNRQWVVTAYALAFGALLLLGGRLGDVIGRRTVFIVGLGGFALASAVGGAASGFGLLVTARAGQGLFGALLAPAALSLLSTTFTQAQERAKAFAIFGAIAGGGGALGLILGGALTEWASWRWCLYVNLFIAVPVMIAAFKLLPGGRPAVRQRIDVPGAVAVSAALFALVYGFANAESDGWGSSTTVGFLIAGVVLLAVFVAIQLRVAHPLLPLRILLDRDRGSSFISMGLSGAGMFAVFLFLTYYLQVTLGYSPIKTGLAFLPMIGGIVVSAQLAGKVLTRVGGRPVVPVGMALAAVGMLLFSRLTLDSSYVGSILPGLIVTGLGMGMIFAPSIQGATTGVSAADAGVASAAVNTVQQIGGSIGTAVFSSLAASSTTSYLRDHAGAKAQAALEGYLSVFSAATILFVVGAVLAAVLLRSGAQVLDPDAEPVMAH